MPKRLKKIPKFKSEKEEWEFWATHGTSGYDLGPEVKFTVSPELKLKRDVLKDLELVSAGSPNNGNFPASDDPMLTYWYMKGWTDAVKRVNSVLSRRLRYGRTRS